MGEIVDLPARALYDLPADEVMAAYREAAAADALGAYVEVFDGPFDTPRGGPDGVPLAVKDLFSMRGRPVGAASRVLAGYRPAFTATAVVRAEAAGMRVIGTTNMDEFAMGGASEYSCHGPTRNPWDPTRTPGGSSGGSAAAVAARTAPWALGSDTGGSVRQPAAMCGIVGFKPTYGAISRYGMIPFASSLDQCGVLARDVADARLLASALVGPCDRDSTATGVRLASTRPMASLPGTRVGVVPSWMAGASAGVRARCEEAVEAMRAAGACIRTVDLPRTDVAVAAYYVIACAEASSNLARYDGLRFGWSPARPADLDEQHLLVRGRFGAECVRRILLGTYVLSAGHRDAFYATACRARAMIAADYASVFDDVDVIVSPTAPETAYPLGTTSADPIAMYLGDAYTTSISLAGLPAVSIPVGRSEGLPVGLQLATRHGDDDRLLALAAAVEALVEPTGLAPPRAEGTTATPDRMRSAPSIAPAPRPDVEDDLEPIAEFLRERLP